MGVPQFWGRRLNWLFQNLSTKEAGVQENWPTNSLAMVITALKTLSIDIWDSMLEPLPLRDQLFPKSMKNKPKNAFSLLKRGKTGPMKTGKRSYLQMSVQSTSLCLEIGKMTVFGLWTSQKLSLLRNPSFLQKSWFRVQQQLQGCPCSMLCP